MHCALLYSSLKCEIFFVQNSKAVTFAEPGEIVQHHNETGLLPGDRLLEVNGIPVNDKSREEIIDLIKSSSNSVTVKVSYSGPYKQNTGFWSILWEPFDYFSEYLALPLSGEFQFKFLSQIPTLGLFSGQ